MMLVSSVPRSSKHELWTSVLLLTGILSAGAAIVEESGCVQGSQETHLINHKIRACTGSWKGHIHNSSHLCADGWRVCGWYDEDMLRTISWKEAMSIKGCFAFNAAQDGGQCSECKDDLEQDDLAGIGRGCPHQDQGQKSCINGGKIDASCCVDTYHKRACTYQSGLTTGILCCKMPGVSPRILVPPQKNITLLQDLIVVLTCQAAGVPHPTITWFKNGRVVQGSKGKDHSLTILQSGDLVLPLAKPSDSGVYTCVAKNAEGSTSAQSVLTVNEYDSGCGDGTSDALLRFTDIHGCTGSWKGHVKTADYLCAPGWGVCDNTDTDLLKWVTSADLDKMNGCYAYNMAGYGKKCRRCGRKRMAGMGNSCSRSSSLDSVNSCNLRHRIEVYGRGSDPGCVYTEGITTGVMCCRKRGRRKFDVFNPPPFGSELSSLSQTESDNKQLPSVPQSINQGSINNNEDCSTYCGENGYCILPGICGCNRGYHGPRCQHRRQPRHRCHTLHCFNGGRCRRGKCKCPSGYWGKRCHKLAIFGDRKKHERRKNKRKTKSRTKCVKHLFRHFKLK